jgi:membrane protein implicated in regulation of membrane protease activity
VDSLAVHPLGVTMGRLRSESGQSTVEFAATIAWLLIAALCAWQLALAGWTAVSAANTAHTVARLFSREQNQAHATDEGLRSLSSDGLGTGASVTYDGTKWTVTAKIPIVVPGLAGIPITQTAKMPTTG